VKLIGAQGTKTSFSLYLAFNAPHAPYQAPQIDLDRYPAISDPSRRAYAAQITAMDSQIGRVVTALDERKMRDDTLIVFQSDNGATRNPMFAGEGDMSKIKTRRQLPLSRRQGFALPHLQTGSLATKAKTRRLLQRYPRTADAGVREADVVDRDGDRGRAQQGRVFVIYSRRRSAFSRPSR
jgi:arylsulfatase A-like enzyme